MNNRFLRLIQLCVLGLDLLSMNILVIFSQFWLHNMDKNYSLEYARFWVLLNGSWILISLVGNLYQKYIVSFEVFCRRTMHVYCYWLAIILLYLFFTRQFGLSRLFIAIILCSQGIMLLVNRFIYLAVRSYFKHSQYLIRKVMIVGVNDTAKKLANYLEDESMYTEIVGFCENEQNVKELTNYPILCTPDNAMETSQLHEVNEIYSTIAPEHDMSIYKLMQQADQACIRFRFIPDFSHFINRSFHIDYLKDIPVISVRKEPLEDAGNIIKKRLFDIVISLFVIVFILSWLIPVLGLLIWLESPGPIFFKQPRSGKNNRAFNCIKFRSMRVSKDAHSKQATKNDNRLTKIGSFIRKTSLDEFPQFLNVLKGDMSIVGPRPHMLKHTNDYSKLIEQYMIRQFLKPGVTGWAQVNGFRGETRTLELMQARVEHDIWYLENWNLWLDVKIMFLTAYNVVRGEKNAF